MGLVKYVEVVGVALIVGGQMANWGPVSGSTTVEEQSESAFWIGAVDDQPDDAGVFLGADVSSDLAAEGGAEVQRQSRMVLRFSWDAVNPPLIRVFSQRPTTPISRQAMPRSCAD